MYLYRTRALFMLPLAVKFDGPLRCIVACCVVNDEVKRNVTCRLDPRALLFADMPDLSVSHVEATVW
jgi:hypothetical protein